MLPESRPMPLVALISPASAWGNDVMPLFTCLMAAGLDCVEHSLGGADMATREQEAMVILAEFAQCPPDALLIPESDFLDGAWLEDSLGGSGGVARILAYAHERDIPVLRVALNRDSLVNPDSLALADPPRQVLGRLRKALRHRPSPGLRLPDAFSKYDTLIALPWLSRRFVAVLSPDRFARLSSSLIDQSKYNPTVRTLAHLLIGVAVDVANDRGVVRLPRELGIESGGMRPVRINQDAVLFGVEDDDRVWWPFKDAKPEDQP